MQAVNQYEVVIRDGCNKNSYDRLHFFFPFCPSRDKEWQPKEHPRPLLHPVALQAAAAATATVLPVPGGAKPADQQHCTVRQQDTRDAVQVCGVKAPSGCITVVSCWLGSNLGHR